jgi:hypothetical protein
MLLPGAEEPVPLAVPVDLAEEGLHPSIPGHPRELVDGRDHERGQQVVDLLVNHDDR